MDIRKLEQDLKQLIVEALSLEDVQPEDIETTAPLFGEGLGLDSIDALELAMAVSRTYGIKVTADDAEVQQIFRSVESLAAYIQQHSPPSDP